MTEDSDTIRQRQNYKFMRKKELMIEIADLADLDEYNPDRVGKNTQYSRFTKEERQQIYRKLSGKPGEELFRNQLPEAIMSEIGEELDSSFRDEFSREDLQKIHQALAKRLS